MKCIEIERKLRENRLTCQINKTMSKNDIKVKCKTFQEVTLEVSKYATKNFLVA